MTIAKGLGTPRAVDKRTLEREYGYYTNILVEIDLSKPIPNRGWKRISARGGDTKPANLLLLVLGTGP